MEICDLKTGQCGPSQQPDEEIIALTTPPQAQILFITDPVCSHCWGMEPAWRKFLYYYETSLAIRYIYGGLLPSWDGFSRGGITTPASLVPHFAEVAQHYGQPIDSSLWLKDPPASSYPASIAMHIVRALQPEKEAAALRRIRQAVFLEARNIAQPEILADCVADIGIGRQQFLTLFQQGQGKGAFQQDLQETHQLGANGFPTLILKGKNNQGIILRGGQPYSRIEHALLQIATIERIASQPTIHEVLRAYGSGTTREFAEILDLEHEETVQALNSAGARRTSWAGDFLWSAV